MRPLLLGLKHFSALLPPRQGIDANLQKSASFSLSRWRERVKVRVGAVRAQSIDKQRGYAEPHPDLPPEGEGVSRQGTLNNPG